MTEQEDRQQWRGTVAQMDAFLESYFGVLEDMLRPSFAPETATREEHHEMVIFDLDEHFGIEMKARMVPVVFGRLQARFQALQGRVDAAQRPAKEVLTDFEYHLWWKFSGLQRMYGHFLPRIQG